MRRRIRLNVARTGWRSASRVPRYFARPELRSALRTLLLLLVAGSGGLDAQTQRPPVFRAGAVLVTVDAYPQRDGQIVEGLTPADFDVIEDGKPQKVENFEFIRVEPARSDDERRDPNSGAEGNALAADPRNRAFVVYLDHYHVTLSGAHATRQPLVDTLRRLLAPNDLFGVMTPKMRPSDLVFGKNVATIDDQLAKHWTWGERGSTIPRDEEDGEIDRRFTWNRCGVERMFTDGAVRIPLVDELIRRRHEEVTLAALEDLVRYLGTIRESRTAILLFSDGWRLYEPSAALQEQSADRAVCQGESGPPPPPLPGVGVTGNGRLVLGSLMNGDETSGNALISRLANLTDGRKFRDIVDLANRHNVSFYPVDPEGLEVFDRQLGDRGTVNPNANVFADDHDKLGRRIDSLKTIAENTGGMAVVDNNDLAGGLRRVVNDMSAYYLLGYYSTNPKFDGRFRRIEVRMKRPGVAVKARRGYFAPNTESAKPAAPDAVTSATPALLTDALAVLTRLRPSAEAFVAGGVNRGDLAIVVEIASSQIAAGKWVNGADVQVAATDATGRAAGTATGKIEAGSRGVLLHLPIEPDAAGPWQIVLRVSGTADPIEDRATISKGPTTALLGDPVIYRAAPGPRAPLRPAADLQFRRTERVHIEWPMLAPFDDRQARLLGRAGQPLPVSVAVTAPQSTLAIDINLAPLGAGDYVIEVTAGTGDKAERRFVAIRVVQ